MKNGQKMNRLSEFRQNNLWWLYALLGVNVVAAIGASILAQGPTMAIGIIATVFAVGGGDRVAVQCYIRDGPRGFCDYRPSTGCHSGGRLGRASLAG